MKINLPKFISLFLSTILFFALNFLFVSCCFSQTTSIEAGEELKALQNESYDRLEVKFLNSKQGDTLIKSTIAQAYLLKAKKESDTNNKIKGYEMLAKSVGQKSALLYLDSIIDFTKNSTNFRYPARAYLLKANILSNATKYPEHMEQLKLANAYAKARNNIDQQYEIKYFIALLKGNLEEYEESKTILKDLISYYERKHTINDRYNRLYNTTLFAYGNVLNSMRQLDSAEIINKKTIRLILKSKDSKMYDRLLLSSAVTHYLKKEYESGLDSIKKFQHLYNRESTSLGMTVSAYVYLSKIYLKLDNRKLAEKYLLRSDSIIFAENFFFPAYRENSELLVKYYKEKKDVEKQLLYIDRLLLVDSILHKNTKYLAKHIGSDYTTPNLLLEKQRIIQSLKKGESTKKLIVAILSLLSITLIIVLVRNKNIKKLYKIRIQEFGIEKKEQVHIIDDETTKRILDKLYKIEQSDIYI